MTSYWDNTPVPKKPSAHAVARWCKESELHKFKPIPDPNGNRAERREAKKKKRKKST